MSAKEIIREEVQSDNVTSFRRSEEDTATGSPFGQSFPQACTVTQRVILVSPFPGEISELVRDLSVGCFDIMMFHHWEQGIRNASSADLVIFDLTAYRGQEGAALLRSSRLLDLKEIPSLLLVDESILSLMEDGWANHELLVWPASPHEIRYHVQRIIRNSSHRRSMTMQSSAAPVIFKDIWIDRKKMQVYREGRAIDLTKTEYELLIKLLDHEGSVLSREDLLADVWDTSFVGGSNVVDVHIKSLRKKLGDQASKPTYIATVRGVGYRLAD